MREFIVQTDMDLNGVVEFEGAGGISFKPHGELIRCKDCKHALLTYSGDAKYCKFWEEKYDISESLYLDGNFYCAGAERKEDADK